MSYIDAYHDRRMDVIRVVERAPDGTRQFKVYPVRPVFYVPDTNGEFTSIFGDKLAKIKCKNTKELYSKVKAIRDANPEASIFESDVNHVFTCLAQHYLGIEAPKPHTCFLDIETDFDPDRGHAPPENPFSKITAITVYLQWLDQSITVAVPPKTLTVEQATDLVKDIPNVYIYEKEADMLSTFLGLLDDADILSGWNSSTFDIPYLVNRIERVLDKDATKQFCLMDQFPNVREFEKFGKVQTTYDLVGRVHLDYLDLYRKNTFEEKASYKLDYIGEIEVNENKIPYDGTLDNLYNHDFKKFIEYNIQDVVLLDKLDKKLKFINAHNQLAHANTVLLMTTMGAVAVSEQALINEAHELGLIVPNRPKKSSANTGAAGAYVAYPKIGIHDWIGSLDVNSLYPSTIRALNLGPETIIGQIRQVLTDGYINEQINVHGKSFAAAWEGLFGSLEYEEVMNKTDTDLIIDWEDGKSHRMPAKDIYTLVFESDLPWIMSANGTIFTLEREGIIPQLLAKWYAQRKIEQYKSKYYKDLLDGIKLPARLLNE
jgi:DNA polymerase elongation subunit (family B)